MNETLLNEIEAFLSEIGMTEATFCRAVGNGRLFARLRSSGKRAGWLWPDTEKSIREYMAAERQRRAVAA